MFSQTDYKKLTKKMAVLQKIRQRSLHTRYWVLFISFYHRWYFYSGGFNSTSKDVGSIDGKDISKILEWK
jgi:peptidyl-prolyl cis-trans isomerase D